MQKKETLVGPYYLYRTIDSKRKSFCILDDNSISIRSYNINSNAISYTLLKTPKSISIGGSDITKAIEKLDQIMTHLRDNKGYSDKLKT